jgi:glutamate dehydrogenase
LQERFGAVIPRHRLRRDLVATLLTNAVANRLGVAGLARLAGPSGDPVAVARAAWLAASLFELEDAVAAADAAPAPASVRLAALLGLRRLQEGAARGLLGAPGDLSPARAALAPGFEALVGAAQPGAEATALIGAGVPERAALLAATPGLAAAPAVVRLAAEAGVAPLQAATAWSAVGESFALETLRGATEAARTPGRFAARAKAEALADLARLQARLAAARLSGAAPDGEAAAEAARLAREAASAGDLVAIGVAARALAGLG